VLSRERKVSERGTSEEGKEFLKAPFDLARPINSPFNTRSARGNERRVRETRTRPSTCSRHSREERECRNRLQAFAADAHDGVHKKKATSRAKMRRGVRGRIINPLGGYEREKAVKSRGKSRACIADGRQRFPSGEAREVPSPTGVAFLFSALLCAAPRSFSSRTTQTSRVSRLSLSSASCDAVPLFMPIFTPQRRRFPVRRRFAKFGGKLPAASGQTRAV